MKKILLILFAMTFVMFAEYSVGDTVSASDNISWTDNYGYSSDIFTEIGTKGKAVMIFFGQTW